MQDTNQGRDSMWQRLAPWVGVAFVVAFVAAILVGSDPPDYDDADGWVAFYDDSGNRWRYIGSGYLLILSAFLFGWFAWALASRLRGSTPASELVARMAGGAGTLFSAMLMVAALLLMAVAGSIEFGDAPVPDDADLLIQLDQAATGTLLLPGLLSAGAFIGLASELGRRTGGLPSWLAWAGYVVAVLMLLGVFFFPGILVPLWVLVTSIVLMSRRSVAYLRAPVPP